MELLGQNVDTVVILIDIAMLTFIALQFIPTPVINFSLYFKLHQPSMLLDFWIFANLSGKKPKIISQCSFNLYF